MLRVTSPGGEHQDMVDEKAWKNVNTEPVGPASSSDPQHSHLQSDEGDHAEDNSTGGEHKTHQPKRQNEILSKVLDPSQANELSDEAQRESLGPTTRTPRPRPHKWARLMAEVLDSAVVKFASLCSVIVALFALDFT